MINLRFFNLLDEPWIIVTNLNGREEMLSLSEVLIKADNIRSLSGETSAQDLAILRLMLGILYAVYTRTDEYKKARDSKIKSKEKCIEVWKKIWNGNGKSFLQKDIEPYFKDHYDGFWLFHDTRPFYQVPEIGKGSHYFPAKMIGEIVESGNKVPLFPSRSGKSKEKLSFSEAARWLVYLSYFDDASTKKVNKNAGEMSVGWLGRICPIYAMGSNLFETLLLNFVLFDTKNPWKQEDKKAPWEMPTPITNERRPISPPSEPIELFTFQSRRIKLHADGDTVVGYTMLGGDQFSSEDYHKEPMTMWAPVKNKSGKIESWALPSNKSRNPSRQMWRDISPLLAKNVENHQPRVVWWLYELDEAIDIDRIQLCSLSVKYGNMQNGIDDIWSDSISMNAALLFSFSDRWIIRITELVEMTDKFVKSLGRLASNLALAAGAEYGSSSYARAMEDAYAELDYPFRIWLQKIDPIKDPINVRSKEWVDEARDIVLKQGKSLVDKAGHSAFVGRYAKALNKKGEMEYYCSPKVYGWFRGSIAGILKTANINSLPQTASLETIT